MSSTKSSPTVKLIGLFIVISGILMVVAGGVTWGLVSSQLKDAKIEVSAVTPESPGRLVGKPVAGPFTAYAQAAAIDHHALDGAGGKTYAQLGDDAKALKAKLAASGLSKEDVAKNPDVIALADTRTSAMNGSFLRASLFTSVVAFGVAALVIGLGVLFVLLGLALRQVATTTATTSASGSRSAPGGSSA